MRAASEIAQLVVAGVVPDLAYLALGLWMLRPLGLAARGAERLALAFVLGSGVASLAILVLRGLDVPVPLVALAGVAVLGVLRLRPDASNGSASPAAGWVHAVDAAALVAAGLTFVAALAPETSWDGFEYHLEARRRASPGAGAIAGLFVLLVPFTLDAAPTTYVDLGVGAYGFLALLSADRWNRTGDARALAACALGLGFAANAKLHAFALCPAALVIATLGGRRPPGRVLAGCTGLVSALVAPWLIKSAFTSGNPFFPFLGSWLGTGPTTEQVLSLRRFRLSTDFGMDRSAAGFLRYLASIHFGNNPHVSGLIGPLPLALAPFALRRLSRPTAVLAGTLAALFGLQYAAMPALRFGAPLLPFLAIAAAVGGARLARTGPPARGILGVIFALLALHHGAALGARYGPRLAALRHPAAYERRVFPDQVALREVVSRAEPVVAIPMGAVLWMPKPVYLLLWERNGELFFRDLRGTRDGEEFVVPRTPPDRARALLERRGVRSLALDVRPPHPRDGRVGHPIVDAWLRARGERHAAARPRSAARPRRSSVGARGSGERRPEIAAAPGRRNPCPPASSFPSTTRTWPW
jgi:hypothetical protein